MKFIIRKFKLHTVRIGTVILAFGGALAILAYVLGYYDISFIDRPDWMGTQSTETWAPETDPLPETTVFNQEAETDASVRETEASTSQTVPPVTETEPTVGETEQPALESEGITSVLDIHSTAVLPDEPVTFPLMSTLEGYVPTDAVYDADTMTIGRMRFDFRLPAEYSLRQTVEEKLHYVVKVENGPYEAEYSKAVVDRPAISLYMGNILIDNGTTVHLVNSEGVPLCTFNDEVYKPAFTRDLTGRPLYYKEGADGKKRYYYLSDDGKNFIRSDYDDKSDSRGLYFDYPAYWGLTDNHITREYNEEEETFRYRTLYGYLSEQQYPEAYDYSDGLACVTSDTDRGGMYFINEYGMRVQYTFQAYLSEHNRYFIWDYALPASEGLESLGFYYYDHGLTRVRYQVIDYYNWNTNEEVRVISEEDRLIRKDGSVYELPAGYELEGYSDGMILLSKNGRYGFMDYTGEWIAEPVYASATPFVCGLAVLETEDGRCGMIDTEGNIVLPFAYDHITLPSSGLIAAYRAENGWTVLRVMEKS